MAINEVKETRHANQFDFIQPRNSVRTIQAHGRVLEDDPLMHFLKDANLGENTGTRAGDF